MAKASTAPVTISGTNFISGATVSFAPGGLAVSNVTFVSSTQINVQVTAGANGKGTYDIVVTNPDGGTASTSGKPFTVTN